MAYLWIKAFHIIFMVAWFAALFYIFRLFVYHVKFKDDKKMCEAYTLMEQKLIRIIMIPGLMLTLIFGLWLVYLNPYVIFAGWFHLKLLGVLVLWGYNFFALMTHQRFKDGDFFLSEKTCRFINEIPTLCLFLIVIMVVVKPI